MRKFVSHQWLSLLLLGLCSLSIQAQETPEAVAKEYMEASRATDWVKAASLMHPAGLKQMRDLFGPVIELAAKKESDRQEMESLFGVKNKEEFDKLSDAEVFAKLLQMVATVSPEVKSALNSSAFDIIGNVPEGAELAHVVFRMQLKIPAPNLPEPVAFSKLEVMTLRRFENTWRAELKGDLQGIIQAMVAGMKAEAQKPADPAPAPTKPAVKKTPVRKKK